MTIGAYLFVATRDPGFVTSEKQETAGQHQSYRNTTDSRTPDFHPKRLDLSSKPLRDEEIVPEAARVSSGKEDTLKNTDTFKYYEFSDRPPVNLQSDEDRPLPNFQPEVQGSAGSQLNDAAHFHLSKADMPVQPNQVDSDKEKSEMDTSEVREQPVIEDVQDVSADVMPVSRMEPGPGRIEDVDLAENSIAVEVRYCIICKVEQPMRAKHCKECGKCVALHDHHCPWLGVCIGERTRCYFYGYLVLEAVLLWLTLGMAVCSFEWAESPFGWLLSNAILLISTLIVGLFTLMVTALLGFHSYLALANLTTCKCHAGEVASWEKISYLKQWPRDYGSPFSRGLLGNLHFYCCARLAALHMVWKMPKQLPEIPAKLCF